MAIVGHIFKGFAAPKFTGTAMLKPLQMLILLLPLGLAGCVTGQDPALPMALGPGDTAAASCLTYGDTPTFGDCQGPEAISVVPQDTN
jgi:hypothetical protein